jgi:alpha-1,6-mannosyltransferase
MNELARLALRVLRYLRAMIRAHPSVTLGAAGFVAGWVTVIAGGRVGTVKSVIPLTSWFGLLSRNGHRKGDYLAGSVMVAGIVILLLLWLVAIRFMLSGRTSERQVWLMAGTWATPFVIGPPLLSNDVFTYSAQGLLLRNGLDPYSVGPSALGNVRAVAAVDPSWRSVPSPYGPLATTIQHLAIAISGGSPLGATIVFRALGVLCLVAIGLLAAELAGPRRGQALTMTVLNPLLLLQVVSAAHLDGAMCVLLLAAVLAANQQRWALGMVLAAAAGSIKAPAFLAALAIIAVHQTYGWSWRNLARDVGIGGVTIVGLSLMVPNGWGWFAALDTPALGHTSLAPASLLADSFDPIVRSASFDDLATAGRITALAAAGCIVAYLTLTAHSRALDRIVGYGMLATGMLSPVVYPWYLLGAVTVLAPTARGIRRDWLVFLSAVCCLLSPPGFTSSISTRLGAIFAGVCACLLAPRLWAHWHPPPANATRSAPAEEPVSAAG